MQSNLMSSLVTISPELLLLVAGMLLLMLGSFARGNATRTVGGLAGAAILAAMALVPWAAGQAPGGMAFGGLFVADAFAVFAKELVLLSSVFVIVMSTGYLYRAGEAKFEYPVLILFGTVGMMMMISAADLMALYMGLELLSLSLYILAAYHRDSARSTEAGLKYFVLGAVASGLLLYGMSMVYGFTGTTSFAGIGDVLSHGAPDGVAGLGVMFGIVFMLAGLAFKVSAAPFHMWTPDVYEGAPTPVTALFAAGPKIAGVALLVRVMMEPFAGMAEAWQQVVVVISILSMVVGAFAALPQTNIKRLLAYSSIGHIGYALVGLAVATPEGVRGLLVYMAIYLVMVLGTFAVVLCMKVKDQMVEQIDDLRGLGRTHPMTALVMTLFMFSMAGIPPLAGFFGKFYVFMAAVEAGAYTLAIIGVLTSVVAAFYYLRIIKVMYFEEPVESLDSPIAGEMGVVLGATGLIVTFFFAVPGPLLAAAGAAAAALGGGGHG